MKSVAARPLVVISGAFAAGDIVGLFLSPVYALVLFTVLAMLYALRRARFPSGVQLLVPLALVFALLGFARAWIAISPGPNDISHSSTGLFTDLSGIVDADPQQTSSGWNLILDAERLSLAGAHTRPVTGRVAVWVPSDPRVDRLEPGDRITIHGRLDRPQAERNPGGFDAAHFLAGRSIAAAFTVRRAADLRSYNSGSETPLRRLARRTRESFLSSMNRTLGERQAALVDGIVLGARSHLPPQLEDEFSRTGTIHVLATAGLHVGFVMAVLMYLWRSILGRPRRAAVATILCLVVYAMAAGGRPAISRAVVTASIYLAAILLDREPDGLTALAAAALWFLGRSPELILDVGFQLSFATVAVIICIFGAMRAAGTDEDRRLLGISRWVHLRRTFLEIGLLSVAAQVGSAPLTAQYFHLFSPVSILANLAVVPAVFLVLACALALWPLAIVVPAAAAFLGHFTLAPLVEWIVWIVHSLADLPGSSWNVASPGWLLVGIIYAAIFWVSGSLLRATDRLPWRVDADGRQAEVAA